MCNIFYFTSGDRAPLCRIISELLLSFSYRKIGVEHNITQLFVFYMLAMNLFIVLLTVQLGTVSSVVFTGDLKA